MFVFGVEIIVKYNDQPSSYEIFKWKSHINLHWDNFNTMVEYAAIILTVYGTVDTFRIKPNKNLIKWLKLGKKVNICTK